MKFYVHPGTGTYIPVDESVVVDLDTWADEIGFTKVSDDLYIRDVDRREYDLDALVAYFSWCQGLERVSLDPPGPDPDGWGGMDPDDHRYDPDCHCNDCASEHGGAS